ncbi:ABC transporter permease subunit [bacterium]|nr:ABC transporter permease subunit [bacterium]
MPDLHGVTSVFRKEVREATRDRNLMLNVVIMPLFLYPVIGFGIFQVMQIVEGVSSRTATVLAVSEAAPFAVRDSLEARENFEVVPVPDALRDGFTPGEFRAWRTAAAAGGETIPNALLLWRHRAGIDSATIVHDASRDRSADARDAVQEALDAWRRTRAVEEMAGVGLAEADLDVWDIEQVDTASASQRGQELLSAVLPLILLLMLTMGTFAAVLDTVVGERERGTLETMLVSPLRRGDVLVGKYLFVVASSLLAFLLNLGSMSLFVAFVFRLLDIGDRLSISIEAKAFLAMMLAAALLAALLAAVLMILAIPARTYREGQASLNPFYLLTMVPGMIVVSSHEPFGMSHALVPVLNATALFKSALRGEFPPVPFLVTYAVLAFTAALAILFASRLAAREDVLLEPKMKLRELLTGRIGGRS